MKNTTFSDFLNQFIAQARLERDYHSQTSNVAKKVVKSALDLQRNLEKLEEINNEFEKDGTKK